MSGTAIGNTERITRKENSMSDTTEGIRRKLTSEINAVKGSREHLESNYGEVWDTDELGKTFTVHGFMAPFVIVTRKADGKKGCLMFQHSPRFYFNFEAE
jgi:hypothetical protein